MKRHPLTELPTDRVLIAPSILAADFSRLGEEIRSVEAGGADVLHVDVMDGHFVPNISIGPPVVGMIRPVSALPFDVHLMLTHPDRYIEPFAAAGADHITVHVESEADIGAALDRIHDLGCSAGITLRPATPAADLAPFMDRVDLILVMTVEPGFGGQSFMAEQMPKMREIRGMIDAGSRPVHLEVDGGIADGTAGLVIAAGANLLVAGTSVFRAPEGAAAAIDALRRGRQADTEQA